MRNSHRAEDRRQSHRAELALYRRCRRGMADALRALFHRSANRWYTAAMMVSGDEQAAAEAVAHTWRRLLERLSGWRFGGGLQRRARATLLKVLAAEADYQRAATAVSSSTEMEPEELLAMPEGLGEQLLVGVEQAAESIGAAYQVRRRVIRTLRIGAMASAAMAVSVMVWMLLVANQVSVTQVAWSCAQQRVIAQDLPGTVGDVVSELLFAEDEGEENLRILQRAGLVLEEIAMAGKAASPYTMRRLADRCRSERLAEGVHMVAERYPRQMSASLMKVGLLLEEVERW